MEIFSVLKTDTRLRMESDSWIGEGALETEFFFDNRLAFVKQKEMGRIAKISDLTENSLTGICVGSQQVIEIFLHAISNALRNLRGKGKEHPIRGFAALVPRGVGGRCETLQETKRFRN
ncbi:hypothetical protein CDAR_183891 [Caerostris darwini]|uniref:Uncharacterized protein n=1 Tax=Caerostris darwini TaxID=1538125 RepID=A0AAV4TUJ9_9ARAC|nr:hypothetical protein CDAR_183891 [Caerostris darwini]